MVFQFSFKGFSKFLFWTRLTDIILDNGFWHVDVVLLKLSCKFPHPFLELMITSKCLGYKGLSRFQFFLWMIFPKYKFILILTVFKLSMFIFTLNFFLKSLKLSILQSALIICAFMSIPFLYQSVRVVP